MVNELMEEQRISLEHADQFVKIYEGTITYYGGDQEWFRIHNAKVAGCGTVAIANIDTYMAKYCSGCEILYPYLDFSMIHYQEYLHDVLEEVYPEQLPISGCELGIWPLRNLVKKAVAYGRRRGVQLQPVYDDSSNLEEAIGYIEKALHHNYPIALLIDKGNEMMNIEVVQPNGTSWVQDDLHFHWVTITELLLTEKRSDTKVRISTWGGSAYLKLRDCLYEGNHYIGGMVYFKV